MKTISFRLTPAQQAAVEIYILDPIHDLPEVSLRRGWITFACSIDRAREILIEAANSADVGDSHVSDRGAARALSNVLPKLRDAT